MTVAGRASVFALLLISSFVAAQTTTTDAQIERRIDALLKQMTVEEKVGQLAQYSGPNLSPEMIEGLKSCRIGSLLNVIGAEAANQAQRIAMEQCRLKIPLIFGYDVIHGYRTIFPIPIAGASSFDLPLIEQAEGVAAKEATASGVKWTFAPMVDIARDPRWGRMMEAAGEDPHLGSMVAAAKVRGFQGQSMADPQSLVACVKHYAAYGAAEGGRDYNTVDMSEQTLREVYLRPYEAAIKAGSGTLMSAFQSTNGVPATVNRHLLVDILRGEWKFGGFIVSDYASINEVPRHGVAANEVDATRMAFLAGTDMDMASGLYNRELPQMVKSGKVPMAALDESVRRVLRIKFKAGLFDKPYADPAREKTDLLTPENLQLARKLAQESIVLLKNQNNALPLNVNVKTLAVIGPLANDKANQLGAWVGNGKAQDAVTPLEGIKAKLPNARVLYAKGVDIGSMEAGETSGATGAAPAPASATGAEAIGSETGPARIEDAVNAAQQADIAVLFVGELSDMTGEASSRAYLDLPGKQMELIDAVIKTGKPVIVVLEAGRPLDIRWMHDKVPAIVQAWYLGTQAGHGIADVLFGEVSPSGRLPISWPRSVGQIPVYYNHKPTGRAPGIAQGRWKTGYLDEQITPLFPFGYGLTYTTFAYSNLQLGSQTVSPTGTLRVSADVQNTGKRRAVEVVQLYVHNRVAPTSRPVRELKGFSRVTLAPGEKKTVEFTVNANDLGSYDPNMKWVVPGGAYDVWVAANSADTGVQGTFTMGAR